MFLCFFATVIGQKLRKCTAMSTTIWQRCNRVTLKWESAVHLSQIFDPCLQGRIRMTHSLTHSLIVDTGSFHFMPGAPQEAT